MSRMRLDDNQLKAAHPRNSVWVSANAGAGKTQVLSNRIARLLLAGAEPASILCLTYTKAGAAEMANRIYANLSGWTGLDDSALTGVLHDIGIARAGPAELKRARQLFALALDTPGGFKIQTIHGFCERILQIFPVEAKMSPGFEILDDAKREQLLDQARDEVLGAVQAEGNAELAAALKLAGQYTTPDNLKALTSEMLSNAALSGRASGNSHAGMIDDQLRQFFGLDEAVSFDTLREQISACDDGAITSLADEMIATGTSKNTERGMALRSFCQEKSPAGRIDAIKKQMFLGKKGALRKPPTVNKGDLDESVRQRMLTELSGVYGWLRSVLQQHDELLRIEATKALSLIAAEVIKRFRAAKGQRAAYDFDDLIERTLLLLTDEAAAQWVLYKLDKAIEHVLVDEAQDTSPPQWQIMKALTEEFFAGEGRPKPADRTVFVVGDQKQSIFSFQGANIGTFTETQAYFAERSAAARQNMEVVPLTVSYRSLGAVLEAVDAVFAEGMPARQYLGVPDRDGLVHQPYRTSPKGIVELWPLFAGAEEDGPDKWRAPRNVQEQTSPQRRLARQIAATIASWIGKRRLAGEPRAVKAGDILLLFRARKEMFELTIAALREAGVPVAGTDRLNPVENIAVEDMLALIRVITLPQDDYALACLLKSPLVSKPMNEEQLFALAHGRDETTLMQRLVESGEPFALSALAELEDWRQLSRECRPYEFIRQVLMERRRHIVARLGSEADDALKAMCEQALAYEREHGASLAGFAAWFRSESQEIKRDMDKGEGEVRLMTVHGAKGLEAPIVFLPDAAHYQDQDRERLLFVSAQGGEGDIPLWKMPSDAGLVSSSAIDALKADKKTAAHSEYTRLLYVAMTRARDELYICGANDKEPAAEQSWYAMASAALTQQAGARRVEVPGVGSVWRSGDDPDWELPEGKYPEHSQADVPACLLTPYPDKIRPQLALSPSRMAHGQAAPFNDSAARIGRVLHNILENLPDKHESVRRDYVERQLRKNGLDLGLAEKLLQVLEQPALAPLFGPGSRAEVGIVTRLDDGTLFPGVIDRMVVREKDVLVIDYKSDSLVPTRTGPDHPHFRQMAAYCFALQKLYPGKVVKAGIVWLANTRLEWLDPTEIDATLASIQGHADAGVT